MLSRLRTLTESAVLRIPLRSGFGFVGGFALTLLAVACIDPEARSPLGTGSTSRSRSSGSSISGSTASSNSMASDGARGACLAYDVTSPTRPGCINCFDTLLRDNCTGSFETDPDPVQEKYCPDRVFRDAFTSQLNLCIQNSILAGFSCNITCSNGLELDPSNCLCITPASISTATGDGYVDVGSENYGAPVVSVIWPAGGPEQIRSIVSPTPTSTNNCTTGLTATDPLYMTVRNRGDTSLSGNIYANPTVSSSPGSLISLQAAIAPLPLNASGGFTNPPPGANVYATFKIVTDNHNELAPFKSSAPFAGGSPDLLFVLAGIPQGEPSLAPTATPSPFFNNALSPAAAIDFRGGPMHLARTSVGNIVFSEIVGSDFSGTTPNYYYSIQVLCLRMGDWCTSGDRKVYRIAGTTASGDSLSSVCAVARGSSSLKNLTALTVDSQGNVLFGSYGSGYSAVSVVCRNSGGICGESVFNSDCASASANGTADTVHVLAMNSNVALNGALAVSSDLGSASRVRGLAIHSSNTYFTVTGTSAGIKAICNTADSIGCTSGNSFKTSVISGVGATQAPAGIAIDSAHNILFWSQTGTGTVHGYCPTGLCANTHGPSPIPTTTPAAKATPIAGTGTVGYSGDGGNARAATLANPTQLALSRRYDGDGSSFSTQLHDHNLIIVEGAKPSAGGNVTGNAVRILCGNNDVAGTDPGFCAGRSPGTIHRIAGNPNRVGHATNAGAPLGTTFANLTSATFDPYKNLIVASSAAYTGPTADGGGNQWIVDHALYTVLNNATVGVSGAKYQFEDSAGKRSSYCLRVTAKQSCSFRFDGTELIDNCVCSIEPGLPSGGRVFEGTTTDEACP